MEIILGLIILIFSAIIHEVAHGYVADRLGDPTARLLGRLTLDPRPHIDPYMTILLPLLMIVGGSPIVFGGAKPVPIDPFNFREGRKDMAIVALVGPGTNLLIAIIASLILKIFLLSNFSQLYAICYTLFALIIQYNLLLAIFNLLPIPPLDGSKVFAMLLPKNLADTYLSIQQMGMFLLLFLLFFPIGGFSLMGFVTNLLHTATSILLP